MILSTHEELNTWLDVSSQAWSKELSKIVMPYSDTSHPLECYPVPKEVGKVGTESSTFIEPISQRKDGIEAMFAKQSRPSSSQHPTPSTSSSPGKASGSSKRKRGSDGEDNDERESKTRKSFSSDSFDSKSITQTKVTRSRHTPFRNSE